MRRIRIELKVSILLVVVLLPLAYFALSHVPSLYIDSVVLTLSDDAVALPSAFSGALASYTGKSLVSISPRRIARELERLPLIDTVEVHRAFPTTLLVEVSLVSTPVVVVAKDNEGGTTAVYVLAEDTLLQVEREDWTLFAGRAVEVEIPQGYATMMEKYGVDRLFGEVMELATSLEGNSSLITRIKYDNNSSNSFGKMIVELSALHAQIWLREPVSQEQLTQAILLIQEDQRESLSFLREQTIRYDLYKGAMVRRK